MTPPGRRCPSKRHLDDDLAMAGKLLSEYGPSPLVGVPVGVVENNHGAMQQAGHPAVGQPVHRLSGRRRTVHPRRGHHDERVEVAEHLLCDGGVHGGLQSTIEIEK